MISSIPTLVLFLIGAISALQTPNGISRRSLLLTPAAIPLLSCPLQAEGADLQYFTAKSGLQWADAKVGTGALKKKGDVVAVDYTLSTTGARYGSKIYSTKDLNAPYRWTLGDGTTIKGLEEAILGGEGIDPMMPGGVRRIIVPAELAYSSLAQQTQDCQEGKGLGPIPPASMAFEEYQRFKNIYCNPIRQYQPDVVMDIKMYGKRVPVATD